MSGVPLRNKILLKYAMGGIGFKAEAKRHLLAVDKNEKALLRKH